jgi:hypothetical protein
MKNKKKLCPLKVAGRNGWAMGPHCDGKKCAWFDEIDNRCALLSIARGFSRRNED